MPGLQSWLESLHLDGYYETFIENRIDADVLPDLTESDLEKLQIPLGDRKRLIKAIQSLSQETRGEDQPTSLPSRTPQEADILADAAELAVPGRGERIRHMTTMFVDLVGSTALSENLDLEDYWQLITGYQLCCMNVIRDYHGFVAKYFGDGVLAYFGYPRATEDDAERAIAAGLQITRAVRSMENERAVKLEARVGIATGRVVVSELTKGHFEIKDAALGDTVNLAARLQAVAEPGTVVISESTRVLLGSHVECIDSGSLSLKGFSRPVPVWRVRKIQSAPLRFDARQKGPMTPFTGRNEELALLVRRWRSVTEGEGRVVLISGEAGIGKSRLVKSFYDHIKGDPHIRLRYQCSPFHTRSALYPVIAQLTRASGIGDQDSNQEKLDKLENLLGQAADDVRAVAPLYSRLLSIPDEGRYRPLEESPETIKEATKLALLEQGFGLARTKPIIVVFEDIHWIDPSTEELLGALIEQIEFRRILILCTYRSEYEAPWTGQATVSTIHLNRLDHRHSLEMIQQLCGEHDLAREMTESIADKTEGVPLFIEELTRTVLEADGPTARQDDKIAANSATPLTLPSTLEELLTARLDSLSDAGEVVTICAAMGRTFAYKLLATVAGLPDDKLRAILDRLVRAQILVQRGEWPDTTCSFRHTLIQEAAYSTILKSRARSLHARIADALVTRIREHAERNPEVVGYHYSRAAMPKEARDFLTMAGDLAVERSDYLEAIAHFQAALQENAKLNDQHDRIATEIALREKLIIPLEARFWGSDDIASNFDRLHELQSEYGDDKDLFAVLDGLYGTHIISGRPDLALDYGLKMVEIGKTQNDATFALIGQHAMGMCHFAKGDFDAAVRHFTSTIGLRPRASEEIMKQFYLADVEIIDRCMRSWTYALMGNTRLAKREIEQASTLTGATDHSFSRAYGFSILASAYQGIGDATACLEHALQALELSRRHKFHYWEAWAQIMHGWAMAACGDLDAGIEELAAGLDGYIKTGSKQIILYAKALLADAYLRAGRITSGLSLIEEIEAAYQDDPVRFHRPVAESVAHALRTEFQEIEG